jgi:AcrR family transcriptional regulator
MPKQTFYNLPKDKQKRIIDAAINAFSTKVYEQVNLSEIIQNAQIPRGSFYQYFQDKRDLYFHLIDIIKETKIQYLGKLFINPNLPFLDLIIELYKRGIKFAIDHPKLVAIFDLLLHNKNQIYEDVIVMAKSNSIDFYRIIIKRDQEKGLLRNDVDETTLATIVTNLTINITLDDLDFKDTEKSYQMMDEHIHHIIDILRKGIEVNGSHV